MDGQPLQRPTLVRPLAALLLFGVSFGYVEAAVVVYLRQLYEPLHQRAYPSRPAGDLFPILRPEHVESAGPEYGLLLRAELARELGTLLMLGAVALGVATNGRLWLAAFAIVFGTWDICFYVFLRVLIGWPGSLFDWDLLFLLPVPWVGPVLAPVLVAVTMIGAGVAVWRREAAGAPLRAGWPHWLFVLAGGVVIVVAFCWDARNILAGGLPGRFNWPVFGFGEFLGLSAFLLALRPPARWQAPSGPL